MNTEIKHISIGIIIGGEIAVIIVAVIFFVRVFALGLPVIPGSEIAMTASANASIPSATFIILPSPSFTVTPLPSPTLTQTPTFTPSETPTQVPIINLPSHVYVFPVQPMGFADFSKSVIGHNFPATDIFAPEGSRFVAPTNGFIDFVSYEDLWNPNNDDESLRGGLSIAVVGYDGVRYYGSHLLAIEPGIASGVRVTAGQTLGYIGHSGNARKTSPHLHFGISHPTYPEDWLTRRGEVNPAPYLDAWSKGINTRPVLSAP